MLNKISCVCPNFFLQICGQKIKQTPTINNLSETCFNFGQGNFLLYPNNFTTDIKLYTFR